MDGSKSRKKKQPQKAAGIKMKKRKKYVEHSIDVTRSIKLRQAYPESQ